MNCIIKCLVLLCLLSVSAALVQEGIVNCGTDDNWKPTGYDPKIRLNERESANNVQFPKAYKSTPTVIVDTLQLDTLQSENLRYELRVKSVTKTGFTLSCITWNKTHIFSLIVRWVSVEDNRSC